MPVSGTTLRYEDDFGYCTVEDVGNVIQHDFSSGSTDPAPEHAAAAIRGCGDWLRRETRRHWFDPQGGSTNYEVSLPTEPRPVTEQAYDIPSSPHSQRGQLAAADERQYPNTRRGTYARVALSHYHFRTIDALRVRARREYTDWVQASDRTEGRSEDYYVTVDDRGRSELYVDTRSIRAQHDYTEAIVADYSYGRERIPETIRRAVALKAAAEVVTDKDSRVRIPDAGGAVDVQTASDIFDRMADEKLAPYRHTPVA